MADRDVKQFVQERYGKAAAEVRQGGDGCCAGSCDPISSDLYGETERSEVPVEALQRLRWRR